MTTDRPSHSEKIDQIKQLLDLFCYERFLYMAVTILSFIVLIICAIILIVQKDAGATAALGMFGSTGTVTFTAGRLLKMWSDAIHILQDTKISDK